MKAIIDEKQFIERLEQFSTEYREEILNKFRNNNKEYEKLRNEFGEILDKAERLSETLGGENEKLIEKFIEVYFAVVLMESNQIYLQGQIDGMRIMKKLNECTNKN